MTETQKKMMEALGIESLKKPKPMSIIYISREEFSLLDATASDTIYYVTENNGTVTMIKGENK